MSAKCNNMVPIPPSTNQCPQMDDQKVLNMSGSGNINKVMEKPGEEILQQQEALKCPRCDSSNTKFCYYNNYSLSQPRHFCKACKRYWTRGGTLRNVPVGGGCRKNKRVKRPLLTNNNNSSSSASSASNSNNSSSSSAAVAASQPHIDTASTSNLININPLFYGLPTTTSSDLNLPLFSRFGFDLHLNNNALGLGFSSGFGSNITLLSSYNNNNSSIFGSCSSSASTTASAMSSLLSSNLLQHKFVNCGLKEGVDGNSFQQGLGLTPLEQLQMGSDSGEALKDVKVELGQSHRFDWNNGACQNPIQHVGLYDPSLYWNNNSAITALGVWNDQANIGSSVTSLI